MLEVSVLTADQQPIGAGLVFQLAADGKVVAQAATDAAGVVAFDVETAALGAVAIRYPPPEPG